MSFVNFTIDRPGIVLHGSAWLAARPTSQVLIEHGMAEHQHRYDEVAEYLMNQGISVYCYDKRGHGLTAGAPGSPEFERNAGFFAPSRGWQTVVEDSLAMVNWINSGGLQGSTGLPLFVLGHSMGSFLVRTLLVHPGLAEGAIAGCIFSGTAGSAGIMGAIGALLTSSWVRLSGHHRKSPFLDSLFLGSYAAKSTGLRKPRTIFEWISSDPAEVDKYIADPLCGMVMRTSFYRDLISGLRGLFSRNYRHDFPLNIPLLLISGGRDPVGGLSKGVKQVYDAYKAWGVKDVELKIYDGFRHELFHEPIRAEVFGVVAQWIKAHSTLTGKDY